VLAVAGFLLLELAQGTRLGLAIFYRQTELSERRADIDAVYRVLRDLVAHVRPASEWEDLVFLGSPHSAAFTSVLPLPTTGSTTSRGCRIGRGRGSAPVFGLDAALARGPNRTTPSSNGGPAFGGRCTS
jgi:hypothetical protein